MNTTNYLRTSFKLILACLFLLVPQTHAREMQPGSDAYTFSTYMIDAFYSEGEECEEKLLATPTIGWLCAAFPLGQAAFEERWDAYLSALPEDYNIVSVTPWGDIKYEEDESIFYGKIYDLNDGRLVVGYDRTDRGREIRLGFSSTANQATAQSNQTAPVAQANQVMLTQAETRAREIAQATYQQAAPVPQTSAAMASAAMATATTTNLATSAVINAAPAQTVVQGSAAMATATTTNLATSAVVNTVNTATTPVMNAQPLATTQVQPVQVTQPVQAEPVQAAPVQVSAPNNINTVNTQEVMAMAQPSQTIALGASSILDVFAQQGLSVKEAKAMTTKDYGFAPVLANEGIFFRIGDCTSCIGRIFSFDRKEDVAMMEVYYSLEAQATDVVFSQDNVLLQFFSTPKDLAEKYITELKALK